MAIKNTGVAARAGQEPAKSAEQVQREYKLQQKFNQISKADNASTTGLLVNPPAAVIPNTTQYYSNNSGSGKEAGAQGMFGAQLGGGGQQYPTVYGQPTPTNSQFAPPVVKGFNAQVDGVNQYTGTAGYSALYNQRQAMAANPFYGAQAGGGAQQDPTRYNHNPSSTQTQNAPITGSNPTGVIAKNEPAHNRPTSQASNTSAGTHDFTHPSQAAVSGSTGMKPPAANITADNYPQWVAYWNYQAQHPAEARAQATADAIAKGKPDPFAPYVMTKDQIWQMKARQRRRNLAKMSDSEIQAAQAAGETMGVPVMEPSPYSQYTGNYYSTILNTSTG